MATSTPVYPGLYVQSEREKNLAFPLKHTAVNAQIDGNLSRVEVIQSFENPFSEPLEAIYIFPLPDEAAVDQMEIQIGDRTLKGSIKKREEAQALYQQAKQQGKTAGLLEQERDNIFTQSLANIQPGEQIQVIIRYSDRLKFEGENYEFIFPMVVGPRYIPGNPIDNSSDTDIVPDASRISPPIVPPGTRSRHEISLNLTLSAGVPIAEVRSPSHRIEINRTGERLQIQLGDDDTLPNKDFILRYQIASEQTQTTILTQADERGGHFALYFIPALTYRPEEIIPKDVVFLVDTSGSQGGFPLQKCQEMMRQFIASLNPGDTFSILDFSTHVRRLSETPLANTPENRARALTYINQLNACGGTEMLSGLRAAINAPTPEGRLRSVVLLSDGYIGNETQIFAEVQANLKRGNRLYSFGAGSSVNRFLLNRVAEIGRGTCQIIRHDEPTTVAEKFFRQMNNPVLVNIEVAWEGDGEPPCIYPSAAPDLFAEQPLVLMGRKADATAGKLRISGTCGGGQAYAQTFDLNFEAAGNPAIAQLWGRARIKELMNQMASGEVKSGVESVTDTALTYHLLSQYTAFVAISDDQRVEPSSQSLKVEVPVEMPEAVSYAAAAAPSSAMAFRRQAPTRAAYSAQVSAEACSSEGQAAYFMAPSISEADVLQKSLPKVPTSRLEIVHCQGLSGAELAQLQQHLQSVNLPPGVSGMLVWEFSLENGRVKHLVLDDTQSHRLDSTLINLVKRSLLVWKPQNLPNTKVILHLWINS
ncbi:MAG: after-VIT domain-containing protein [Desertifilum sp. SIO1I2]|nr:after-VIT domain-containing protein [Desertifilum sp. SIO1I2]